jgi:hypothetical protein
VPARTSISNILALAIGSFKRLVQLQENYAASISHRLRRERVCRAVVALLTAAVILERAISAYAAAKQLGSEKSTLRDCARGQ